MTQVTKFNAINCSFHTGVLLFCPYASETRLSSAISDFGKNPFNAHLLVVDKGFFFSLFVFVSRCGEPPHCQVKMSLPDMEDDKLIGAGAFHKKKDPARGTQPT